MVDKATSGKELFVTRRCFMQQQFQARSRKQIKATRQWLSSALLLLAFLALACRSAPPPQAQPTTAAPAPSLAQPTTRQDIGFASRQKLIEHYEKHGREFGAITQAEYLRQAQSLRDRAAGGEVLEIVRADGVITRFDRATGAFLAFNPNATIRTYFKPNDGEAYFRRQSKRAAR
jgi:hypothetical protein